MWAKGVVVATPALDDDLGLLERVEDLAVEQLVAELTSVTPIERIASATGRPCAVSTSTCRSLVTISSGLCRFLDIDPSSTWPKAIPQGGPLLRGQTRRRWHQWLGVAIVRVVALHVGGLYVTSPEDTTDALLLVSPTPFSVYGVTAMWGIVATAILVLFRRRLAHISHSGEILRLTRAAFGRGEEASERVWPRSGWVGSARRGSAWVSGWSRVRAQAAAWRNRAWASAHSACQGQPDAMANLTRRTEMRTRAPILRSLSRIVPQVASRTACAGARCGGARTSARRPSRRTRA